MITVLIPTNNRPDFLREALESVERQSAVKSIDHIILSDNSGTDATRAIVDEFKGSLPIDLIYYHPCSAHEHIKMLLSVERGYFSKRQGKYTAILHDDDAWCPGHLATALHALESVPRASSYLGCHFDVRSMNSMLYCTHNFYAWFASNFAALNCAWVIPPENAVLACLMGCIGHYSTMVARTDAFKESSYIFNEPDADFDNDRRLQFALSQIGQTIYNPMPQVFVRHHDQRDCVVNFTDDERIRHMRLTTQWIIKNFDVKTILDKFCANFDARPAHFRNNAAQYLSSEWCLPEIGRYMKKRGIVYDKQLPGVSKIVSIAP